MSARAALLLVAALALGAGCRDAVDRVFSPPRAVLQGVRLRSVGLGGGSLEIALRVSNPNPYALTATGASYRLLTGDSVELGRGATGDTVRVAARDSVTVRLPLDVDWNALQRAGLGALERGEADYRIIGEIVVNTPVGGHAVPLDAKGRYALGRPR